MTAEEVLNNLLKVNHEQKLAHAYLFETNDLERALLDLKKFIKKIVCSKEYQDNCLTCNLCNLIDNNSLPSLLIIRPDGSSIKKDQIELIKNAFATKPIYTSMNIYIIVEPELMNDTAYNKMLKFIEEPENDIIGFFLTKNKDKIPATIISRLEILKLHYLDASIDQYESHDNNQKIEELLNEYVLKINHDIDELLCYNTNVILKELPDKSDIIFFYKKMLTYFQQKYYESHDIKSNKICRLIIDYLEKLNYNVNISLLLDSFAIEMGQLYEE